MLAPVEEPFPFEAVRDLLGILRAMYAAAKEHGGSRRRLLDIQSVGQELRAAVDLALEHEPGTLGHAAAWQRAERAARRLADLVDATTPLEPTLEAAAHRVVRAPATAAARRHAARRSRH